MSEPFLESFLSDYYAECEEHLALVRRGLLALEQSVGQARPDAHVSEELFRSFHSLKGISAMVEHRECEQLAHEMEGYLRALRDGQVRLSTAGVDALIDGTAAVERSLAAHRAGTAQPDSTAVVEQLRSLVGDRGGAHQPRPVEEAAVTGAWRCLFTPSPALVARGVNVDVVRTRLRGVGEILRAVPIVGDEGGVAFEFLFTGTPAPDLIESWRADNMVCSPYTEAAPAAAADTEHRETRPADAPLLSSGHYVRVDLARLDELMRMIGDLVIMRARLVDALGAVEEYVPPSKWRTLQETTAGIERHLRDLREGVMRVRLVPVGEIFRRMPFVVRDLARDTGRRVRVDISGQEAQIDKFLVERMMDPALHLVRNAVAHGIEPADERIAAGKPPEGTLTLSGATVGELVTIEIADDGRGIDAERVAARARQAGLMVPDTLDDAGLLELICSPGFSTRDESDRASGRGFGMAVVHRTVQELGGSLRLWTKRGEGTRFTIELPLTLAVADALLARVGSETFAVPQASVREAIEVNEADVRALEDGEVMPYRGAALPLVRLTSLLEIAAPRGARGHALVIGTGASAIGLVVDRIVGQREIVVRTAVDPLLHVEGISGATDLGDGRAVLILDAAAIARRARHRAPAPRAASA